MRILLGRGEVAFGHIAREEHGLGGEQLKELHQRLFIVAGGEGVGRPALVEMRRQFLEQGELGLGLLVARFRLLLRLVDAFGHGVEVGEHQLRGDHFDVPYRIDVPHCMDHIAIFKTAHHLDDGVDLPDVGEELVAQAFALAGAGDQTGDVHELDAAGMTTLVLAIFCSTYARSSGTITTPTLGSMVQNG